MREEYTRDNYPTFGKKYNGEKAIISLTSWKARIDTVSKTLYSLLKQCPGFHIVLVLSEEEFPNMMDEIPENLKLFVKNNLIEVLWVYKNYKSFKKVLFTMDKYRDVPVISADDDCFYIENYAQRLYDKWEDDKSRVVMFKKIDKFHLQGTSTLYPPNILNLTDKLISDIESTLKKSNSDDTFFSNHLIKLNKTKFICLECYYPFRFHDEISPIHKTNRNHPAFKNCY